MQNRLVRVTSTGKNTIGLVRLGGGVSGALDLEKRRLGSSNLAETVSVFRYTADGIETLSLNDLGAGPIPNGEISYAHTNWAGQVDIIALGAVGRGATLYGRTSITMDDRDATYISIYSDQGKIAGPFRSHYDISGGVYVAAVVDDAGTGGFSSLKPLTALKDVPNTAWSGESAVTVDGRSYSIPASVMVYNLSLIQQVQPGVDFRLRGQKRRGHCPRLRPKMRHVRQRRRRYPRHRGRRRLPLRSFPFQKQRPGTMCPGAVLSS